jgi:hypothetical protein
VSKLLDLVMSADNHGSHSGGGRGLELFALEDVLHSACANLRGALSFRHGLSDVGAPPVRPSTISSQVVSARDRGGRFTEYPVSSRLSYPHMTEHPVISVLRFVFPRFPFFQVFLPRQRSCP